MRMLFLLALVVALPFRTSTARADGTPAPFVAAQYFDNDGDPCNGCKLFVYASGTSTKVATYTDADLSVANANPIVLDSAGRATIFLTPGLTYKLILAPDDDTDPPTSPIWTRDEVPAVPGRANDVDVIGTAGEAIAVRQVVFLADGANPGQTAGRWYLADADTYAQSVKSPLIGFATAAISSGAVGTIRIAGRVTDFQEGSTLTTGITYYISATAGGITATAPTNARAVLIADSTTAGLIPPAGGANIGTGHFARIGSNVTHNASATLTNVTGLSFPIHANERWIFRVVLYQVSGTTPDWQFAVTVPAEGVLAAAVESSTPAPAAARTATSGAAIACAGTGADDVCVIHGLVTNGSTAGTVQIQAAQRTSDASNSVIYANSHLIATRVW